MGKGIDDKPIAEFSRQEQWVIVTYDPDFVKDHDPTDYFGAVYFENETLSANQVSGILDTMASHYPESAFEGLGFGSTNWL